MSEEEGKFFEAIGKKIATFRKKKELTQVALAKKIGVQQQVIASYEIGRRRIPLFNFVQLSKVLQVNVKDILPADSELKK